MRGLLGVGLVAVTLAGCAPGESKEAQLQHYGAAKMPVLESFEGWPADNLPRPSEAGNVERELTGADGRTCFFMIPDWAEPSDKNSFKGPHGGTVWFSCFQRDPNLVAEDRARIEGLIKTGNRPNQTLVIARPWRGWYGESDTSKGRLRIYLVFQGEDALEIHTEWPAGSKDGLAEAQELAAGVIYSAQIFTGKTDS